MKFNSIPNIPNPNISMKSKSLKTSSSNQTPPKCCISSKYICDFVCNETLKSHVI